MANSTPKPGPGGMRTGPRYFIMYRDTESGKDRLLMSADPPDVPAWTDSLPSARAWREHLTKHAAWGRDFRVLEYRDMTSHFKQDGTALCMEVMYTTKEVL